MDNFDEADGLTRVDFVSPESGVDESAVGFSAKQQKKHFLSGASKDSEGQKKNLDRHIHQQEEALGIRTDSDKAIEAGLFIDNKFLKFASITGRTDKPEKIFGDDAWADHLDARLYAREYGRQELTVDFIREVHRKLLHRSNPDRAGKVRTLGVKGGAYDEEDKPVTYTQDQIRAIEGNPQLGFERVPPDDPDSTTGRIVYPYQEARKDIAEQVKKELADLSHWYNEQKQKDRYNPHILAGVLQHRLASLHPFFDGNGGLSRLLMNWSLENDGQSPSILEDPNQDILTDEESWIANVSEGSRRYADQRQRQANFEKAGIHEVPAVLGLGKEKAFYDYVYRYIKNAPHLPANGDKLNHGQFEHYLGGFTGEMEKFEAQMSANSKARLSFADKAVRQGGLITKEFMQFALKGSGKQLPQELKNYFLSDVSVYRGGMVDENVQDEQILRIFQAYTGVEAGYRALQRSGFMSAMSLDTVNPKVIQESMDYYNKVMAFSYLQSYHPEVPNPYTGGVSPVRDMDQILRYHTAGGEGVWISPFASTSLSANESRKWASTFANERWNHGVLVKGHLPREGTMLTFGTKGFSEEPDIAQLNIGFILPEEREALTVGGVMPTSIEEVQVYDRRQGGMLARRIDEEGSSKIEIEDKRGEFVVKRQYTLNAEGAYTLTGEETTDILSRPGEESDVSADLQAYFDTLEESESSAEVSSGGGLNSDEALALKKKFKSFYSGVGKKTQKPSFKEGIKKAMKVAFKAKEEGD